MRSRIIVALYIRLLRYEREAVARKRAITAHGSLADSDGNLLS
jgi:hypothetical protein